jgi:beta-lactamase superfamily II metal-dependent hydrolase
MNDLLESPTSATPAAGLVQADIMELPHHGSHNATAERFVDAVNPRIVMQSTGWMRWNRDKWAQQLKHAERLVTARDGACSVQIDDTGKLSTHRFVER